MKHIQNVAVMALLLSLAACGGGGDGSVDLGGDAANTTSFNVSLKSASLTRVSSSDVVAANIDADAADSGNLTLSE